MNALVDIQTRMAGALLTDPDALPADWFASGPVPLAAALQVHRDTVLGALVRALRLTFPTVDALVGETAFDRLAAAFAQAHPPARAHLSAYGEGFPKFLERVGPAAGPPSIGDVARFDLAIDRTIAAPMGDRRIAIDAGVCIVVPASLRALRLDHPADRIRDALDANDNDTVVALERAQGPYGLAIWRSGDEASVRPLGPPAALFLQALLAGDGADRALATATGCDPERALSAIQTEVFAAPFALITTNTPEGQPS